MHMGQGTRPGRGSQQHTHAILTHRVQRAHGSVQSVAVLGRAPKLPALLQVALRLRELRHRPSQQRQPLQLARQHARSVGVRGTQQLLQDAVTCCCAVCCCCMHAARSVGGACQLLLQQLPCVRQPLSSVVRCILRPRRSCLKRPPIQRHLAAVC
jgi:hypothetical protein